LTTVPALLFLFAFIKHPDFLNFAPACQPNQGILLLIQKMNEPSYLALLKSGSAKMNPRKTQPSAGTAINPARPDAGSAKEQPLGEPGHPAGK
jgi:hypothetical protein